MAFKALKYLAKVRVSSQVAEEIAKNFNTEDKNEKREKEKVFLLR